jgi:hypothetical protein
MDAGNGSPPPLHARHTRDPHRLATKGSIDYKPPPAQHQTEEAVMATSHVPHHQFRPRLPTPPPSCPLSRPLRTLQDFRTGEGAHVL